MPNILTFKTLDESGFLEFGVSNAKCLVCQMPNIWHLTHLMGTLIRLGLGMKLLKYEKLIVFC